MSRRPILHAALAFALAASPSAAQERPFPYVLGSRDAVIVPVGVGLSLLGDHVANNRDPLTRADIAGMTPDDVNGFDRTAARNWSPTWADRSDVGRDVSLVSAVLVSFAPMAPEVFRGRLRNSVTLGTMFAESYLLLRGVTYTTKGLAGRTRPFTHNTSLSVDDRLGLADGDPQDAYQSFFSGHSAAAFALATLMSTVYADIHGPSTASKVLWASSLSVAGFTAYARVKAGMHYPSDVLVGAAVGTAIGLAVPWLHRRGEGAPLDVAAGPGGVVVRIRH